MDYLAAGARCVIGVVFVVSSVGKARAFRDFVAYLGSTRLLDAKWVPLVARCVVVAEFCVWILVALPVSVAGTAGFVMATGLLMVFAVGIARVMRAKVLVPCMCFGVSTSPLGVRHVVRNVVLALVASLGAVATSSDTSWVVTGVLLVVAIKQSRRRTTEAELTPALGVGGQVGLFATSSVDGELVDRLEAGSLVAFLTPSCRPCREKVPDLVEFARAMPGRDHVLAVVVGDMTTGVEMVTALRPVAKVVVEERYGPVQTAFRLIGFPAVLMVGTHGVVTDASVDLDQPRTPLTDAWPFSRLRAIVRRWISSVPS